MITPSIQASLAHARRYFREHLNVGDYYAEGEKVAGTWFGNGAEQLGLNGSASEKDFLALCGGEHPKGGGRLTARQNRTRIEKGARISNRRVFYDFVFRPPKSVSLVALVEDERVVRFHRKAVLAGLAALERYAATRVRKDGACDDRRTGNIVAALFEHDTSREQDPLLHTHAVVFNATWDQTESRWKALQTHEMFKAIAYADAVYNTELTRELARLGYPIRRMGKTWEIAGVPRELIEKFSKRRMQIASRLADELKKPENAAIDPHVLRDRIARDERKRKIRGATRASLIKGWRTELGADGNALLRRLRSAANGTHSLAKADYAAALAWGKEFVFERKSVVRLHELVAAASRRLFGTDATMDGLVAEAPNCGIISEGEKIVSVEGLRREWDIVERAQRERNRHRPFAGALNRSATLSDEQRTAVSTLLQSRDGITLFRGAAGTGKSHTLRALASQLESAGHKVQIAAPQGQQVRSLAEAGLPAVTLARLLHQNELPLGSVVIVDEAGQVGGREMEALLNLARQHAARVILSGDTRQHPSVEASDAMRSLESFAQVTTAEIKKIRRQDPNLATTDAERRQIHEYRQAVMDASEGRAESALLRLGRANCVHETPDIVTAVADEFDTVHATGRQVLAVSQTREMTRHLNRAITDRLKTRGALQDVRSFTALAPRDTYTAEKRVRDPYEPGVTLRFTRRYGQMKTGTIATVTSVERNRLVLDIGGHEHRIKLSYSAHWELLERHEIPVGVGSTVQVRANGTSPDGHKLVNGELLTVTGFTADNSLLTRDRDGTEKQLGPENRILELGYAVTSFGAQGRTTDAVILADAGVAAATNQKEWYVSLSRARRKVAVFTPDVARLARRISESGDRMLGLELIPEPLVHVGLRSRLHRSLRRARAILTPR